MEGSRERRGELSIVIRKEVSATRRRSPAGANFSGWGLDWQGEGVAKGAGKLSLALEVGRFNCRSWVNGESGIQ